MSLLGVFWESFEDLPYPKSSAPPVPLRERVFAPLEKKGEKCDFRKDVASPLSLHILMD